VSNKSEGKNKSSITGSTPFCYFAQNKKMTRILTLAFCLITFTIAAQTSARIGLTASPTIAWAGPGAKLDNQFFTVSRAGFNGGITLAVNTGQRLFFRFSASYSQQSFAIRQSSVPYFKTDVRNKIINLELPLVVGVSGFLGSLRHREYVGVGLQLPLSHTPKIVASGDSASVLKYSAISSNVKPYPVAIAGFEIGSEFKNDGAIFFGANFRYGFSEIYSSTFTSNRFNPQTAGYKGTYTGFELTYYFPRFSYWFKRDFTF